jgi:hypothetical protein
MCGTKNINSTIHGSKWQAYEMYMLYVYIFPLPGKIILVIYKINWRMLQHC